QRRRRPAAAAGRPGSRNRRHPGEAGAPVHAARGAARACGFCGAHARPGTRAHEAGSLVDLQCLDRVLVLLASGLVLVAAVLALRPLLLRLSARAALRQQAQPLPPRWPSLVSESVPATRHLSDADRLNLRRASRELIRTRHWEGCQGVTLTEEIQLIIAAQACLLTLALPGEPFPGVREILVYPRTFVPRRVYDPRKWLHDDEPEHPSPLLGESWGNGVVVLSWEAVLEGAQNPADGSKIGRAHV